MSPNTHFQWRDTSLWLQVYLQPGASSCEWAGMFNYRIKIRLPAPPVDGQANRQLLSFIATEFGVKSRQVSLIKGANSRNKTIAILAPHCLPSASLVKAKDSTGTSA